MEFEAAWFSGRRQRRAGRLLRRYAWRACRECRGLKSAGGKSAPRKRNCAACRLGIEITDEEVVKDIIVDRLAEGEEPDVNAYYAPRVAYGIGRKTIQEIIRAQLAWRALLRRTCRLRRGREIYLLLDVSCVNLEKLRQKAVIEYRG